MDVQEKLANVKQRIHDLEKRYGRQPGSVRLLPVSKAQPLDRLKAAIAAGETAFGENRVQEALPKIELFADKNLEWHFIGPIQSNKTKKIAEHFSWAHSVCDGKVAKRLNEQRPTHLPPLNICIEVNVSHDPVKFGLDAENLIELATYCYTLPNLKLRGLMTMPIKKRILEEQRTEFHKLKMLYDKLIQQGFHLDTLSMGMTNDLEAAIAEGSTLVRLGTAVFGERVRAKVS